jgi:hypothetical protein
MTLTKVTAGLHRAEQELSQAQLAVTAAARHADEARDLVARALRGSSPGHLLALMDTARVALRTATKHVEPARQGLIRTMALAAALDLDAGSDVDHWVEHLPQPVSRQRALRTTTVSVVVTAGCAIRRLFRRRKLTG